MKNTRNTKILNFVKTDHFMHKQWERKFDDALLRRILPHIPDNYTDKHTIIITPSFLQRKGLQCPDDNCLIIALYQNVLKTLYYCNNPSNILQKYKDCKFNILF